MYPGKHTEHIWIIFWTWSGIFVFKTWNAIITATTEPSSGQNTEVSFVHFFICFAPYQAQNSLEATQEVEKLDLQTKQADVTY